MVSLVLAFIVSLFVSGVIIRLSRTRALAWDDHDLQSVQKFHARAVPRVGGLAIALGLAALLAWVAFTQPGHSGEMALLLACGLPPLLAGLAEDLTKQVGIRTRLLATATSGALAFFLLGAQLSSVQSARPRLVDGLHLVQPVVHDGGGGRRGQCGEHHRRLQRAGFGGGGHLAAVAGLRGLAGGRQPDRFDGAGRRGRVARASCSGTGRAG